MAHAHGSPRATLSRTLGVAMFSPLGREQPPPTGNAPQLVQAPVHERQLAACHDVTDGGRDQHLARIRDPPPGELPGGP